MKLDTTFSVSQFVEILNQILDTALPFVRIQGEISNYQVRSNKWVSFRLKDENNIIECFGSVWQLQTPLQDGMQVIVSGRPGLSGKWGKFSISLQNVVPVGEGSILKSLKILETKLAEEGLFDKSRKRSLPRYPQRIGLVSSPQADGYNDFIKICAQRWPLAEIIVSPSQVQGEKAPQQLAAALQLINQTNVDVIAVVRGGGSSEDLLAFSSESVVRAIAASKIPTVVGVGHEVDVCLAQLAADAAASTPTHAAQTICPDKHEVAASVDRYERFVKDSFSAHIEQKRQIINNFTESAHQFAGRLRLNYKQKTTQLHKTAIQLFQQQESRRSSLERMLLQLDPRAALKRGYAIIIKDDTIITSAKQIKRGQQITIRMHDASKQAEII